VNGVIVPSPLADVKRVAWPALMLSVSDQVGTAPAVEPTASIQDRRMMQIMVFYYKVQNEKLGFKA
jgi:hypothetical protein